MDARWPGEAGLPGRRAHARAGRPDGVAPAPRGLGAELSGVHAAAGNRAAGQLIRSLQRVDYTQPQVNVAGTGITRLEVHDLRFGVDEFQTAYGDAASDEANKTRESPSHMAVVLVPDKLRADAAVQVVLHFHGWGFRPGDPYAGYLVAAKGGSSPAGTVRDVDQEHWEQQIASLKGDGAQVVVILAQGRGPSDFGHFPTFEYVRDVLEKSGRSELVALAEAENYSIVLSGHSGGGSTKVVPSLHNAEAETRDRTQLATQTPANAGGRVIDKLAPVDLVVLYEALNGDGDVLEVIGWVHHQLDRIIPQLEHSPDQALAVTPTLRGYYGNRPSGYRERYRWLACLIEDAIESRVPERFRADVADRFRIIEVTGPDGGSVEHEQVMSGVGAAGAGSVADALRAARNPRIDRDRAVALSAEECAALKARAKARAEARAKAAKAAKAAAATKAAHAPKAKPGA